MSDFLWHRHGTRAVAVALPHDHAALLSCWAEVRSKMVRAAHPDFTRAEWAYLIQFTGPDLLGRVFADTFGDGVAGPVPVQALYTPVGRAALWLPNNVSLLGPLTLVLLSLAGCAVRVKSGSRNRDLCAAFAAWLRDEAATGALKMWLQESVHIASFDRTDARNADMAAWADVRILFGGDDAAAAVERLPHPSASSGYYFAHKVSEAWVEPALATDDLARELASVFGIYGQAGCTSPKRVVLLDGTPDQALAFARKLGNAWAAVHPGRQPRHVASETLLATQWARSLGHETVALGEQGGVAVVSAAGPVAVAAHMAIAVQWGTLAQTLASQPGNLQTIGHALASPADPAWLAAVGGSPALRFVPLRRMHHFGPAWDGQAWWRGLFRERTVEAGS